MTIVRILVDRVRLQQLRGDDLVLHYVPRVVGALAFDLPGVVDVLAPDGPAGAARREQAQRRYRGFVVII